MTIEECRNLALKLVDEYSSNGDVTADVDINFKIHDYINAGQNMVCEYAPIKKLVELDKSQARQVGPYVRLPMPKGVRLMLSLVVDGVKRSAPDTIGTLMQIPADIFYSGSLLELEYESVPQIVSHETFDSTQMDLSEQACIVVAYYVAYSILSVDLVSNPDRIRAAYNEQLASLKSRTERSEGSVRFESGGLNLYG